MNPLRDYLDEQGISQKEFGERFDPPVSQGLVWQWCEWLDNPEAKHATPIKAELAPQIEKHTNGQVLRHQIWPDLFPKPKKAKAAA